MKKKPLIVIAGPTASGKTSLGVEVCKEFSGEVISADSMQIYKGMDIATAKPTKEEIQGIPHHMTDFLPVDESFSVADFQRLAAEFADEIYSRNHLPVIVGGTGLYIDSFVNNTKLTETPTDQVLRQKLFDRAQNEGAGALLEELRAIDPEYAENLHENNIKRVVRALELWYSGGKTMTEQNKESHSRPSPYDVCYICLDVKEREYLYDRINKRVDKMLEDGLLEEAKSFSSFGPTSAQAIGYKELKPYFDGEKNLDGAIEALKQSTRRYAKRQLTWFRRRADAHRLYIDEYKNPDELKQSAFETIKTFLNRECER